MGGIVVRGGVPSPQRFTVPTTVQRRVPPAHTQHITIRNTGASVLRVYFTQLAIDIPANAEWMEVAAGETRELPAEVPEIWFQAVGAPTAIEVTYYARRG